MWTHESMWVGAEWRIPGSRAKTVRGVAQAILAGASGPVTVRQGERQFSLPMNEVLPVWAEQTDTDSVEQSLLWAATAARIG